ncbi:MAG: 16S rRNA (guanine(966)-N(2))-methyltransferase RsmD [Acidimicrobiaceae bacterium]|nr:16S rRNA (guanine(966)-N(2))-methyltransferase RsmD [Acidimicrobiaceae bacterium]
MRVVAGTARGRRLAAPEPPPGKKGAQRGRGGSTSGDPGVRPTTDRGRESTFNALHSRGAVVGARVLDLFAGTGALGIEALSRGADHATFVDRSPEAVRLVETNLVTCDLAGRATVLRADGPRWLRTSTDFWDLVLLDPPYDFSGWEDLLALVADRVAGDAVVVVESDREVPAGDGDGEGHDARWHVDSRRRVAGTVVTLLRPGSGLG